MIFEANFIKNISLSNVLFLKKFKTVFNEQFKLFLTKDLQKITLKVRKYL